MNYKLRGGTEFTSEDLLKQLLILGTKSDEIANDTDTYPMAMLEYFVTSCVRSLSPQTTEDSNVIQRILVTLMLTRLLVTSQEPTSQTPSPRQLQ